jgi:hypothetical protein
MRIHIYDTPGSESDKYREAMRNQCKALGIELHIGKPAAGTPADLTVAFANRKSRWTKPKEQALQQLVNASALVLPVIDNGPAAKFLPKAVGKINAFKKQDSGRKAWVDSLVDESLSMAWLKRRTRKVFISYRRIDSAPIANQLFARFNELGYEVFLDDASIKRGADFQRELKWWLNDADLLLALHSPRLTESKWCVEELAFAQTNFIGIAALEWPSELYADNNKVKFGGKTRLKKPVLLDVIMSDQRMELTWGDFSGVKSPPGRNPELEKRDLTPKALERVVAFCARKRAAAIHSRLNNLLPLVKDTIGKQGASGVKQAFGDLTFADNQGKQCFLRVLPFRPLPEHLYGAYTAGGTPYLSLCAYSECDAKDVRAEALRWFATKTGMRMTRGAANSELWAFYGAEKLP